MGEYKYRDTNRERSARHINCKLDHCSLNNTKTVDGLAHSIETNPYITGALTPRHPITNERDTQANDIVSIITIGKTLE